MSRQNTRTSNARRNYMEQRIAGHDERITEIVDKGLYTEFYTSDESGDVRVQYRVYGTNDNNFRVYSKEI